MNKTASDLAGLGWEEEIGTRAAAHQGIVLLAHTNFDSPFVVGSHHLRRILESTPGIKIVPVEPFSGWRDRSRSGSDSSSVRPKLWLPLRGPIPSLREKILALNALFVRRRLSKLVKKFPADRCVILDNPYAVDIALWLKSSGFRLVTRLTDWMPGQIPSPDRETNFRMLRRALAASDLVIVTSKPLAGYVRLLAGKIPRVITNGVDHRLLEGASPYAARTGDRVLYYGAFDDRIDAIALRQVAEEQPDLTFDIFTPSKLPPNLTVWPSNVHFWMPIPYSDLSTTLAKYTFAILPLSNRPSNHSRFPMKLFELLGCGVQVVAPPLSSLTAAGPIPGLYLGSDFTAGTLGATFRQAREEWLKRGVEERQSLLRKMRERARSESWDLKAGEILNACRSQN